MLRLTTPELKRCADKRVLVRRVLTQTPCEAEKDPAPAQKELVI